MVARMGSGDFVYEVVIDWAKLPQGWSFVEVADVAVDSEDRVFAFNRGKHPVIIFDRDGRFLSSWGEGVFGRPHGLTIGPDGSIYCADDGDHTVRKCTPDGKVLMTLGVPGKPAPAMSGRPFNRPTKVALDPATSDILVADGYKNARVHRYSADGTYLSSWGEPGTDPGQFHVVHAISADAQGRMYVSDRENLRVQIFDSGGKYLTKWNDLFRPTNVAIDHQRGVCYVAELGPDPRSDRGFPNVTPRIAVLDFDGKCLARLGGPRSGTEPAQFMRPHGIALDSRGDLYISEVSYEYGQDLKPPREVTTLRKLVRVSG